MSARELATLLANPEAFAFSSSRRRERDSSVAHGHANFRTPALSPGLDTKASHTEKSTKRSSIRNVQTPQGTKRSRGSSRASRGAGNRISDVSTPAAGGMATPPRQQVRHTPRLRGQTTKNALSIAPDASPSTLAAIAGAGDNSRRRSVRIQKSLMNADTLIELVSDSLSASPRSASDSDAAVPTRRRRGRGAGPSVPAEAPPPPRQSTATGGTTAGSGIVTPGCKVVEGAYDAQGGMPYHPPRHRYIRFGRSGRGAAASLQGLDYDADSADEAFIQEHRAHKASRGSKAASKSPGASGVSVDVLEHAIVALEKLAHTLASRRRSQAQQAAAYKELRAQRRAVLDGLRVFVNAVAHPSTSAAPVRSSGGLRGTREAPAPPRTWRWGDVATAAECLGRHVASSHGSSNLAPSSVLSEWERAIQAGPAAGDAGATLRQTERQEAAAAMVDSDSDSDTPAVHVAPLPGNGDISDSEGSEADDPTHPPGDPRPSEASEPWSVSTRQAEAALSAARVAVPPALIPALVEHWRRQRRGNKGGALLRAYQSISLGDHGVGVGGGDDSDAEDAGEHAEPLPSDGEEEEEAALRGGSPEDEDEATSLALELRKLKRLRQSLEQARMMVDLTRKRDRFRRDIVRNTAAMRLLQLAGCDVAAEELVEDRGGVDENTAEEGVQPPGAVHRLPASALGRVAADPPRSPPSPKQRRGQLPLARTSPVRTHTPRSTGNRNRLRQSSITSSLRKAAVAASAAAAAEVAHRTAAGAQPKAASTSPAGTWHSAGRCSIM